MRPVGKNTNIIKKRRPKFWHLIKRQRKLLFKVPQVVFTWNASSRVKRPKNFRRWKSRQQSVCLLTSHLSDVRILTCLCFVRGFWMTGRPALVFISFSSALPFERHVHRRNYKKSFSLTRHDYFFTVHMEINSYHCHCSGVIFSPPPTAASPFFSSSVFAHVPPYRTHQ